MKSVLEVEIREKSFAGPDGRRRVILRDIAFRLEPGEFVAIVGPSGAGKTTLLNIIAGLDSDFSGAVRCDGSPVGAMPIGYVFQEPRLLPWRTVFDNVALVVKRGDALPEVTRLLAQVGLAESAAAYPSRLSLGMARRVALARALAIEPELLLLDEPFVSLDQTTAERLRRLLLALWRARRCGVLFVTHDLREAVALADRILLVTGSPGHLVLETTVPLSRDGREDGAALDAACAEIAARHDPAVASATP